MLNSKINFYTEKNLKNISLKIKCEGCETITVILGFNSNRVMLGTKKINNSSLGVIVNLEPSYKNILHLNDKNHYVTWYCNCYSMFLYSIAILGYAQDFYKNVITTADNLFKLSGEEAVAKYLKQINKECYKVHV